MTYAECFIQPFQVLNETRSQKKSQQTIRKRLRVLRQISFDTSGVC